jgi:ATP-dependent Clp protease ATP-binding subunit ClpA
VVYNLHITFVYKNMDSQSVFEVLRWFGILLIISGVTFYLFKKGGSVFSVLGLGKTGGSSNTRNLEMFSLDLTALAREGKIDPVIGREEEISRATQVLTRRHKNNVILAGPPGVGKTAIVEGLAMGIVTGDVPDVLQNKRILSLRVSELLAGTKYRGEFEQRVKKIVEEIRNSGRSIILFIDELHTVMQTKGTEGAVNFSDILKPALARGDLQLIGATTMKEYEEFIKPDESVARRFQLVTVDEPSVKETVEILQGVKKNYETYHHVKFIDKALEAAARLSHEYIKDRRLPDKAIDLMDEAGAMVNVHENSSSHHAAALMHGAAGKTGRDDKELDSHLKKLRVELKTLREKEEDESGKKKLDLIRKQIVDKVKDIEGDEKKMKGDDVWPEITDKHIKEVVADWVDEDVKNIH